MKLISTLTFLTTCLYLLSSCNKQETANRPNDNDTAQTHLKALEMKQNDGSFVYHVDFHYDSTGRIIRTSFYNSTDYISRTNTVVTYNGNEAVLVKPPVQQPGIFTSDTIYFVLDDANKPMKRIEHEILIDSLPGSPWISQYNFDTTNYEYDDMGLLKTMTRISRDSLTQIVAGSITNHVTLNRTITDYTNANGNVVRIKEVSTSTGANPLEKTTTFEYNNAYPNNVGLTNPAILTEFNLMYGWPLNNGYKNLPEKITATTIIKDVNGAIVFNETATTNLTLGFKDDEYLWTLVNTKYPTNTSYFFYSK